MEDKLRALGGPPESAAPAAVHGRAVLGLYGELKAAVQRFEEGDEAEVGGVGRRSDCVIMRVCVPSVGRLRFGSFCIWQQGEGWAVPCLGSPTHRHRSVCLCH